VVFTGEGPHELRVVAQQLVEYAAAHGGPTLVHFDEVGSRGSHDVNDLRGLAAEVWQQLRYMSNTGKPVPTIYFLVTGRSTEPFESIGSGVSSSPCGSRFLVLDMLKPQHVGEVRRWLTGDDRKSTVPKETQLKLHRLHDVKAGCHLDTVLTKATGGAPRLLLYTLRAMAYLQCPLDSVDAIDSAVFEVVYDKLSNNIDISREFLPDDTVSAAVHFSYLLALSLAGPLSITSIVDKKFAVGNTKASVAHMLRFQPFFLSRQDAGNVTLELPAYHRRRAHDKFASEGVPMLLLALPQTSLEISARWRVFELLVPHAIAVRAGCARLIKQDDKQTWAKALPRLFRESEIAARLDFHLGDNPFKSTTMVVNKEWTEGTVPPMHIADGVVYPPEKASSEDAFHFQHLTKLNDAGVVAWQMKLFDDTPFQMATLATEVGKCMTSISEVFVIACTNYGPELLNVINGADDRVVVLKAWSDGIAAVYSMGGGGKELLWRSGQRRNSKWCVFPSKITTDCKPKNDTSVTVRPGLEVVLPHPDVVTELVGRNLMAGLQNPAANTGLIITSLDNILSGTGGPTPMAVDAAAGAAAGKWAHALWVALRDAHCAMCGACKLFSLTCAQTVCRCL
jgi:hypothetical protein